MTSQMGVGSLCTPDTKEWDYSVMTSDGYFCQQCIGATVLHQVGCIFH